MFAAEFEPAEASRRRARRAPVSLDAEIGRTTRTLCKVVDVSVEGAKLQTYSALKRGSMIWLTLPVVGAITAEVMWADDFLAGCRFARPLAAAALEAVIAHDCPE